CIVTGLFWFSLYTYVPQMSTFAKGMGASYKMIGIITGAYGLTQTVLRIPLGIVSDILNKRKIFINMGLFTTIFSALIVFLFPNPYTLLIGRLLAGVAAATWVSFTVMFSSYYKYSESTKAMGVINSANMIGQFAAVLVGGALSFYLDMRYVFLLSAMVGFIGFLLSFLIPKEEVMIDKEPLKVSDLLLIVKDADILHICFLGVLSQLITFATIFGFTPIIAENLGANNFELGLLTTVYNFPQIVFSILAGTVFIKYLGAKKTLLIGFSLSTVLCMVIPFVPNLTILYVVQIFNGIGKAMTFPILMGLVIKDVDSNLRTTAMGVYQAIYGVGMIIGPVLLGAIGDQFGLTVGFVFTGLLGLLAIASIWIKEMRDKTRVSL
ncbi:MAG TPA: MFS transporter, partial [Epulopiscium sp.]|nr:MFS transporter [Candidatus Epulonipiscium sp.]